MATKPFDIKPEAERAEPESVAQKEDFDALLTDVAENRDKASFVRLFEYFAPRIKSFLMKGGLSPEQADELAQETMLAVWHKASGYNPAKAKASTWIFTIARNKRIDLIRKNSRQKLVDYDPILIEDDAPSAMESIAHAQEEQAIAEAMQDLPEDQAKLIQKSFFENKSHADIAHETGIPLGTVKSRIRLALNKLRNKEQIKALR